MMSVMASQITGVSIIYSTVCSGADERKHESSNALCEENSSVTGEFASQKAINAEMFPFDDVIMSTVGSGSTVG